MLSLNPRHALLVGAAALALVLGIAGFRLDGLTWIPDTVYSDAATSHYPAALFLRQSVLDSRQFPLWREGLMAGAPFAANPLNKTGYPLQWAGLLLDPVVFLNGAVLFHLALAGWGMWRWSRELGLGREGALVSALAYMLAPRLLAGLGAGHLDLLAAAAWWPWLMMAAMRLGRHGAWRDALFSALFAALLALADVRLALFALPTAGVAFAVAWWRAGKPRRALMLGLISAALAGGLALAVIAPLVGWSPWMNRGGQTNEMAAQYSLNPANIFGLLLPLTDGTFETLTYLGLATLILALVGAWKLPKPWRWALLGGLVLVILWGFGPNAPLWTLLAGQGGLLAWFRVPARIWYLVALVAAPLAGFGIETLLRAPPRSNEELPGAYRWYRLGAFGLLILFVLSGLFLLTFPVTARNGLQIMVAGFTAGVVLLLILAGRLRGRTLYWAFVALLIVDAALGARAWIEWRPLQPWLASFNSLTEFLQEEGAARVYSPDYSLPQEVAANAGIRLFGGVDPFQIAGVTEAVLQAGGITFSGYSVVVPPMIAGEEVLGFNRGAVPDAALLAEWDVSHVTAGFPIESVGLELADVVNGVYVYRNAEYVAHTPSGAIPDWPAGWPGLPDASIVARLNHMTEIAWFVSMALLAGVLLLLAIPAALNGRRVS